MIEVFLEVKPTPKSRPRLGKNSNVYTPKRTSDAEAEIRLLLKLHMSKNFIKITEKPLIVSATFHYKENRSAKINPGFIYKISRPDIDNIFKLVADAMNGIVYHDDCQIVKMESSKIYGPADGIDLKVIEI